MFSSIGIFLLFLLWNQARAADYETVIYDRSYSWTRSSQTIQLSKNGESTTPEILQKLPGNTFSSPGSHTRHSFFPRGMSAQSVQIYVDGMLLNDPADPLNRYDFSDFDFNFVEQVEYNPTPAFSGKPGGSLFFWTSHSRIQDIQERHSYIFQELTPRHASRTALLTAYPYSFEKNPKQWSFSGARHYSRNKSQAAEPGLRELDSLHLYPFRFSYLFRLPLTQVSLHTTYSYLKESLDQDAGKEDFNAYQITNSAQAKLSLERQWSEFSTLKTSVQQNASRRKFRDPSDGPSDFSLGNDYRSFTTIADFENSFRFSNHLEFVPQFFFKRDQLKILGDSYMGLETEDQVGGAARASAYLEQGWRLFLFARTEPSYGLNLEKDLGLIRGHVYLSLNRAVNRPTLYQKRAPFYGNSALKNEDISTAEIGIKQKFVSHLSTQAALFQSYGEEQIEFSYSKYQYENVGISKIWGAFANITYDHAPWTYEQSHTFLETKLLRRPRWTHFFKIGRFLNPLIKSEIDMRWNASQQDIFRKISPTQNLNLKFLLNLKDEWRAWLKLNNLLNQKRAYVPGYERQGFNVSIGAEHEF